MRRASGADLGEALAGEAGFGEIGVEVEQAKLIDANADGRHVFRRQLDLGEDGCARGGIERDVVPGEGHFLRQRVAHRGEVGSPPWPCP